MDVEEDRELKLEEFIGDYRDDKLVCAGLDVELRNNSSSGGKCSLLESLNGLVLFLLLMTVVYPFEAARGGGFFIIGDGVSTVT